MVELKDSTFAALANATRRDMLARLAAGEATVGALAEAYDISLNAVSKHLSVLEEAGLVSRRVEWRTHYIRLNPEPLRAAHEWLEAYRAFWDQRLDALEQFLARKKAAKKKQGAPHAAPDPAATKNRRQP